MNFLISLENLSSSFWRMFNKILVAYSCYVQLRPSEVQWFSNTFAAKVGAAKKLHTGGLVQLMWTHSELAERCKCHWRSPKCCAGGSEEQQKKEASTRVPKQRIWSTFSYKEMIHLWRDDSPGNELSEEEDASEEDWRQQKKGNRKFAEIDFGGIKMLPRVHWPWSLLRGCGPTSEHWVAGPVATICEGLQRHLLPSRKEISWSRESVKRVVRQIPWGLQGGTGTMLHEEGRIQN